MTPGATPLVLCADDYGMNAGIGAGILELAGMGRISATSCMTNSPIWREEAGKLSTGEGRIATGLHLTLSWGAPLGPMPVLAPDGRFPALGRVSGLALTGQLDRREIRAEIARQLDAFEAALGRAPDFVDGHQHVHVLPGFREPLLTELVDRGWAGRLWLRDPSERWSAILGRRRSATKALAVAALATGFGGAARRAGFSTNAGFSGFSAFDPGDDAGRDMDSFLDRLGPGPLVMCHPGGSDPDPDDRIAASRARELAYLGSPAFAALLAERRIRLVGQPGGVIRP